MRNHEFRAFGFQQADKILEMAKRYQKELEPLITAADILSSRQQAEFVARFLAMPQTIAEFSDAFRASLDKATKESKRK